MLSISSIATSSIKLPWNTLFRYEHTHISHKPVFLADIHSCSDLLLASTNYTEENFPEVVKGDEFLNLTREEVCYLISSDQLSVGSEERVFESVINWVRHDVQSRKKCLPDLLEHVRMPLLSKG